MNSTLLFSFFNYETLGNPLYFIGLTNNTGVSRIKLYYNQISTDCKSKLSQLSFFSSSSLIFQN